MVFLQLGLFKEAMEDATVVICTADDQSLAEKALRRSAPLHACMELIDSKIPSRTGNLHMPTCQHGGSEVVLAQSSRA